MRATVFPVVGRLRFAGGLDEVSDAARELRDLAHGIHTPLLAESGLLAALAAAARGSTLPTTVDAAPLGRYPGLPVGRPRRMASGAALMRLG
jgi:hypothetical protein